MRTKLSVTWIRYIFVYLHVSYSRDFKQALSSSSIHLFVCLSVILTDVLLFAFDWKTEELNSMKLCKTEI